MIAQFLTFGSIARLYSALPVKDQREIAAKLKLNSRYLESVLQALSYIRNYGEECYKRIYCYEITPSVFAVLKNTLARYRDIEYRLKGVSDECGAMKLQLSCGGNSANVLSLVGEETVETTTLDADISEPVSLIKADIEGYELKALRGAARHIVNDHPKLLISVYHSNDDIWEIPKTIHAFSSDYRFYLRFKGSCIYPTEITLFAL